MNKTIEKIKLLSLFGYEKFNNEARFDRSSHGYYITSIQNKDTDPIFYSLMSENGEQVKCWSWIFKLLKEQPDVLKWDNSTDEFFKFRNGLYINEDRFLILPPECNDSFFNFIKENIIVRPQIKGLDTRLDLGNKVHVVSDAGILFSSYEYVLPKIIETNEDFDYSLQTILTSENQQFSIINDFKNLAFVKNNKSIIGPYGEPFTIQSIDVFPKGNTFYPRLYVDFE